MSCLSTKKFQIMFQIKKNQLQKKKYKGLSQNIYKNNAGSVVYIGNPSVKGTGSGFDK